ncbi:nose resistant to fluoxetine protein 6-like isoform X2 [Pseudomyrmex gracilis]|nr:nose resistant to fluoxetine protein 6-like isoform X2 [Pseudomyrmex gracilis]
MTVTSEKTVILYWGVAITCNILVLFGLYKRYISVLSSATYVALSRTVWAIGIAWILIACLTRNGGIVNKLLSFRVWIPLSKLTYCAYLLHPFIIYTVRLNSETSLHLDIAPFIIMSFGYLTISYLFAYLLSVMTEIPCILLTGIFLKSSRRKNTSPKIEIT